MRGILCLEMFRHNVESLFSLHFWICWRLVFWTYIYSIYNLYYCSWVLKGTLVSDCSRQLASLKVTARCFRDLQVTACQTVRSLRTMTANEVSPCVSSPRRKTNAHTRSDISRASNYISQPFFIFWFWKWIEFALKVRYFLAFANWHSTSATLRIWFDTIVRF